MSLQLAAEHLSTKGRGPDDTLVHMSRGEVKSLNDLAMAHGGHLTINPETGLPEAGFLSAILPLVAGAALGPAGFGLTAMQAGMAVGAGSYLLNRKAGLMGALSAGMGAYGGAGLGDALAQQGMQQAAGQKIAAEQATNIAGSMAPTPDVIPRLVDPAAAYAQGTPLSAMSPLDRATLFDAGTTTPLSPLQAGAGATPAQLAAVKPTDFMGRADMLGQGIKSTFTDPNGFSNLYNKMGGGFGTAKTALAAAAPFATLQKDESAAPVVDKDMGQRYTYSPGVAQPLPAADVPTYEDMLTKQGNFGKQQNYYPNQGYTKVSKDEAKNIYGFADGGPVERMSNNAAMGANTMYPMANMATSSFATPYQTPQSTNMLANMVAPSGGGAVNAMSGEPNMQGTRMAEGGEATSGYTYDPQTQRYTGIMSSAPMMPTGGGGTPLNYAGAAGTAITDAWNQMHPEAALNGGAGASMSNYSYDPSTQRFTGGGGGGLSSDQIYLGGGQYGPNEAARKAAAEAAAASDSGSGPGAARGGLMDYADGGLSDARYNLGGYSDGGRLLRGPGDGVSDSIPAVIGKRQPARLADGEFVVPARIVSEIGNGSTEAGARKLYGMMDRVQAARGKTVGKGKVARNTRADKYLPA
jgi:hypothetical protein